jgi:DNA-binding transcriptional LysR family regulator
MNAFWGSGRLERFLITASSQTVNDAAQRIGAHADSLSISIRGLGEVVGGPLLVRAPPSAPLRLTPLGRKLSRQANLHADDLKRWGLSIPVAEAEAAPQN